jgi:hypothetical protein
MPVRAGRETLRVVETMRAPGREASPAGRVKVRLRVLVKLRRRVKAAVASRDRLNPGKLKSAVAAMTRQRL